MQFILFFYKGAIPLLNRGACLFRRLDTKLFRMVDRQLFTDSWGWMHVQYELISPYAHLGGLLHIPFSTQVVSISLLSTPQNLGLRIVYLHINVMNTFPKKLMWSHMQAFFVLSLFLFLKCKSPFLWIQVSTILLITLIKLQFSDLLYHSLLNKYNFARKKTQTNSSAA